MEEQLTHSTFSRHLDTIFRAEVDGSQHVDLQLTEVSDLRKFPQQEEFSITLVGPADTYLGQGIRSLEHDAMGVFDLFIVPIAQDQKGFHYQAIFNRVIDPDAHAHGEKE